MFEGPHSPISAHSATKVSWRKLSAVATALASFRVVLEEVPLHWALSKGEGQGRHLVGLCTLPKWPSCGFKSRALEMLHAMMLLRTLGYFGAKSGEGCFDAFLLLACKGQLRTKSRAGLLLALFQCLALPTLGRARDIWV